MSFISALLGTISGIIIGILIMNSKGEKEQNFLQKQYNSYSGFFDSFAKDVPIRIVIKPENGPNNNDPRQLLLFYKGPLGDLSDDDVYDSEKDIGSVFVNTKTGYASPVQSFESRKEYPDLDVFMMKRAATYLKKFGHSKMFETAVYDSYLWEVKLGGLVVYPSPYCSSNHAEVLI
jgi:hypothetical protein